MNASALPHAADPGRVPNAISRAPRAIASYPLTPTQHGMLVHALRAQHPGVELEQIALHLPEPIDAARMRAAWAWASERFEALRTAFAWQDEGEPRQRVFDRAPLPLELVDHRALATPEARDAALARFLEEDRARGIDLSRPPLARLALISRGRGEHVLVWSFHHVLLDGRSFTRVLRETMARYDAELRGEDYDPPRPPPFRAHCEHLARRDPSADRAFWTEHLRGFHETTPLPARRARASTGGAHRELWARVGVEATQRLRVLADASGFTVANAVQAAWAIVLARHAREDDVCFGVTRAGRHGTVPEALEAVGCLIQTTPLRVRVPVERELASVLRELRAVSLALRPHEHASLVAIREWAGLPASAPLFESTVVFERYRLDRELREQGGAWSDRRLTLHQRSAPPIVLAAYQDGDDLLIELEHDVAEFEPRVIARAHEHVVRLLRAFPDALRAPIGSLPMIGDEERAELHALAGGDAPLLAIEAPNLPAALAAQVERTPHAIAIASDAGEVSFAALDRAAGALAARLAARGVATGEVVAVCTRRGAPLATALLGILRAGAVYLPIDPGWPAARIAMVLEDARARVVVVDSTTRELLGGAHSTLDLESPGALSCEPAPLAPIAPESPATLIYTSGSTGRPKGVLVPHRALLAHARAIVPAFALEPRDRCLQFTSPSFDVSLEEMLPTWLAGGCVVPRSEGASRSIDAFLDEVERHRVTVVNLPSAFFTEVALHLREHARRLPPSVRLVVVGGERPSAAAYASFRAQHPEVAFLNAYGPTEVTVTSTICDPVAAGVPEGARDLPIGRPLGACRAYVLDAAGNLAPRGAVGELALAGPQVALGYLGRPELTAERFARDAIGGAGMLMRTGDLVRWSSNDVLEILGRADEQLKIRGFRMEPGEIEAVLRADPRVRDVVVGARPDPGGAPRLVAWYVPARPIDAGALRAICEASLPAAMIPSAFVAIDALPIGTSGKIDRRALPAPALDAAAPSTPREPPRGELEQWIARVFAELLGRDEVGADESFFALGGHSLLAVRLMSRLSTRGAIELDAIFRAPTVRGLARALAGDARGARTALVPLNPAAPGRAPMHVLCGVHIYDGLAHAMASDRQVVAGCLLEEAEALVTGAIPLLDVPSMAAAYITRIRAHRGRGPYVLGGVSVGGLVAYEAARQLRARGEEVALVVLFDTIMPRGLFRAGLADRARAHLARLRDPRAFAAHLRRTLALRSARRALSRAARGDADPEALRDEAFRMAAERYDAVVRPYDGPVLVFTARHRRMSPGDRVAPDLGWNELLRGPTRYVAVDGDHLSMLKEPGASQIAAALRDALGEV